MSLTFSIYVISKNSGKTLGRLASSLKDFLESGGEAILVDTGSTDGSESLARELGFAVYEVGGRFLVEVDESVVRAVNETFIVDGEQPIAPKNLQVFHFSLARNYAASLARNDAVFSVDSDEQLTMLNIPAIETCVRDGWEQLEFQLVYAHYRNGKPSIQAKQARFYDRRKLLWVGTVHEVLGRQGDVKCCYVDPSIILLEHFQEDSRRAERENYILASAIDSLEAPDYSRSSYHLGRDLVWTGRYRSGIRELERQLSLETRPARAVESMTLIGDAYLMLGDEDNALSAYHKAVLMNGFDRAPWLRLAQHFWKKGDHQRTASYCAGALAIPGDGSSSYPAHCTFEPHELMYWAKWYNGDVEGSKKHYDLAFGYDPANQKYLADRKLYYPEVAA